MIRIPLILLLLLALAGPGLLSAGATKRPDRPDRSQPHCCAFAATLPEFAAEEGTSETTENERVAPSRLAANRLPAPFRPAVTCRQSGLLRPDAILHQHHLARLIL